MKLREAVKELAKLPNPKAVLRKYPNKFNKRTQHRANSCPVAQFLTERVGKTVSVGYSMAYIPSWRGPVDEVKLPKAISDLVYDFDREIPE